MFQLGMFGFPVDNGETHWWITIFRDLFLAFDTAIYTVITWLYQIVFFLADATIFSRTFIVGFFQRFQMILGVIMIFKLSISVLQVVMNPELMNDKKRGAGQIVTRVLVMLAMLTAIMPLNIPKSAAPEGSYEEYIRDNGLLFGTLYSLQSRVLRSNAIGKLIMGTDTSGMSQNTVDTINTNTGDGYLETVEEGGNTFATSILRGFLRPNLKSSDGDVNNYDDYMCQVDKNLYEQTREEIANDEIETDFFKIFGKNYLESFYKNPFAYIPGIRLGYSVIRTTTEFLDTADKINNLRLASSYTAWMYSAAPPSALTDVGSLTCKVDGGERYAFSYLLVVPTIVGAFVVLILIGYCLDIAIRTIKLAILRLIAPIAIISYIDPQSSEKGAFANWVKLLISTYLDLFIRLVILFLITFLASSIFLGAGIIPGLKTNSVLEIISKIILVIGVFYFARQAPKFISDALGIKSMGMGVGLSGVLGGLGAFTGGAGIRGLASGFMNASQDAADAAAQGKAAPPAFSTQRDRMAQLITGDKNAKGGLLGSFQRAMNDRANNATTRRLFGIDRSMSDAAKKEMFRVKGEASAAEERYKRFTNGTMTDEERSRIESAANPAFAQFIHDHMTAAERHSGYGSLSLDRRNDLIAQFLESDWGDKQTAANKQESWYKDSSAILEGFNLNERPQEKYSSTRRFANSAQNSMSNLADRLRTGGHGNVAGVVNRAGRVVGSVAGSPGQRRANRLGSSTAKNDRGYGVSYQHRDDRHIGVNDEGNV